MPSLPTQLAKVYGAAEQEVGGQANPRKRPRGTGCLMSKQSVIPAMWPWLHPCLPAPASQRPAPHRHAELRVDDSPLQ